MKQPKFTLRILSDKYADTPEEAVKELLKQIASGEVEVGVFEGDNLDHKDTPDHEIYIADLHFEDSKGVLTNA